MTKLQSGALLQALLSVLSAIVVIALLATFGFAWWLVAGLVFAILIFPRTEAFLGQSNRGQHASNPWAASQSAVRKWSNLTKFVVLVFFGSVAIFAAIALMHQFDLMVVGAALLGLTIIVVCIRWWR